MTSIRGRLLATLLIGLLVVLAAGGAAVYLIARTSLLRQLDRGLLARAEALASLATLDDGDLEFELDEGHTDSLDDGYFEYRGLGGSVFMRSGNLVGGSLPPPAPIGDGPLYGNVSLPGAERGRAVWLPFTPRLDHEAGGDAAPGRIVIATALDREPVDRALASILAALFAVGGLVAVTVGGLISLGVRWGLSPLDRLGRGLGAIGGRTISTRFDEADAPAELAPFYRELNRMLDRVERTLTRERSFANAAAHELRTPLAELRATAEVALRWPDADRAATALGEALAIGREMERLVEALLLISRGKVSDLEDAADEVSVEAIVHHCVARAKQSIDEKQLELTVDVNGHTLHGPPAAVEIMVRNLIDNAVQYTPSAGRVAIRNEAGDDGGPAALVVENNPVALSEEDLPRLFEPFWRADGSRTDRAHVGLGMSVVNQIAHALGLRIDAGLAGDRLQIRIVRAGGTAP